MKKKKIIGIVLVVVGLFCVFGAFSIHSGAPKTTEVIRNAVYVSDGKVLPENEGKVVIVPGTLDAAPFVDQETGIVISDIVAYRKVEQLAIAEKTKNDTTYEVWSWRESFDKNAYGGTEKLVAPNVTLGDFRVASELLQHITLSGQRSAYDNKKELNQYGWHVCTDNGKVYLSAEEDMPKEGESVTRLTEDYRHSLRVSYVEMSGGSAYTVVALQKDGQLVNVPDVTLQALHPGHLTQAEILERAESSAKTGMILAIVVGVVCLGVGAFLTVRKEKQTWIAALLAILLLITAGCEKSPDSAKDNNVIPTTSATPTTSAPPAAETTGKTAEDVSLSALRQAMMGTPQLFAVAYFGYHETPDSPLPVDPLAVMREYAPQLCADFPFLPDISEDRIVGDSGDLFCIVPLDENATVAVSKGLWDEGSGQYLFEESLYFAENGEPILLFCNHEGWEPDTQVCLSGPSGEIIWYPQLDDNLCVMPHWNDNWDCLLYDFSPYREMLAADYRRTKEDVEWEAVLPTKKMLIGNTWTWSGYLKDGRETRCSVTFREDTLSVSWNNGVDRMDHVYPDAAWELNYAGDYAILSIDFREFAGILRYNLLYSMFYESLYVAQDVTREEMNIGWEPLSRFLMKPVTPDPTDMAGTWELIWTEVEGNRNEAAPGSQTIMITTDYEGLYWISYTDNERSDWNYYNKELVVFPFGLYDGCINDQWLGAVNHTGKNGTGYDVTLLNYDTLLLQEEWVVDGASMVGYGYFRRVWEDCPDYITESPYDYAVSQGWHPPELGGLVDSNWRSYNGYALDLLDDSVPGDNGGRAIVYDVNEIGAYTKSYSGSWHYEDGMLHLSLVPVNGNGVFVDDSFPVLMLDGQLWIGRNSSGLGLPHFYSDTLADVLDQPKG